jgi:hypothetical protein
MWREICPRGGSRRRRALEGHPGRLILAGVPWVTSRFPSIPLCYNMESLSELDCLVLYTKLSSCPWAHMSARAGPTNRSTGPLVGRARLSGMAETLVGGDLWVPCLTSPRSTCRRSGGDEVMSMRSEDVASMKSHRVHGDTKRKSSLGVRRRTSSLWRVGTGA